MSAFGSTYKATAALARSSGGSMQDGCVSDVGLYNQQRCTGLLQEGDLCIDCLSSSMVVWLRWDGSSDLWFERMDLSS